jgi:hypothetical protein
MSHFAVIREAGPAWTDGGITAQPAISDHAAFMNTLADEGLVVSPGRSPEPTKGAFARCSSSTHIDEAEITTDSPKTP